MALFAILLVSVTVKAQWDIQESHTGASLRGIHNVGGGVAWASGTDGTVHRGYGAALSVMTSAILRTRA